MLSWDIKFQTGMRYGHGTCTILQHSLKWLKKIGTLECNRTWQSAVPETSAKVYGAWCIPTVHGVYPHRAQCYCNSQCKLNMNEV